jgi:hypothetical protein
MLRCPTWFGRDMVQGYRSNNALPPGADVGVAIKFERRKASFERLVVSKAHFVKGEGAAGELVELPRGAP